LRRRKSITKKKKKMKKSKPNKPTNKKYKWPDTQLTPSQPVRQKKLKNTKKEKSFSAFGIYYPMLYTFVQHFFPAGLFTCLISSQLRKTTTPIPRTVTLCV
jgi:hypothetical protein